MKRYSHSPVEETGSLPWKLLSEMMVRSFEIFGEKKDYLDSINVFPVPDGDTGINMYLTLRAIVERINNLEKHQKDDVCEAISQGAFMGAKGNSGTILSQFLRGWVRSLLKYGEITPETFAKALDEGRKKAYDAVMDPKEGTMLTVFRLVAAHALKNCSLPWSSFIHEIFEVSQEATLKTREMMDVLKEGEVVDSGALGIVYIFQGWAITIEEHVTNSIATEDIISGLEGLESHVDLQNVEEGTEHRYCTEALIKTTYPIEELRTEFHRRGSFFMISSEGDMAKMHIHTNQPHEVIRDFKEKGSIQFVKIDDMVSQAKFFR